MPYPPKSHFSDMAENCKSPKKDRKNFLSFFSSYLLILGDFLDIPLILGRMVLKGIRFWASRTMGEALGTAFLGLAKWSTKFNKILKKYFIRQPVGREAHGTCGSFFYKSSPTFHQRIGQLHKKPMWKFDH